MTSTVLLTVLALAAPADAVPAGTEPQSIFAAALKGDAPVVRGQSPALAEPMFSSPSPVTSYYQTPTYAPGMGVSPTYPGMVDPYAGQVAPFTSDPWLGGAPMGGMGMGMPMNGMGQNQFGSAAFGNSTYGLNGPQPYRFGWTARHDFGFISESGTNGVGDLKVFEYNYDKELVVPWGNWVFSIGPQYNLRLYDGPSAPPPTGGVLAAAPASPELPGNVHRIGLDLTLTTPTVGGWTIEGGFNPAIASDFQASLSGDSILYDAHLVAFWRWSQQWMWALGAAYWDRVDDIVIPYAGAVWTPNDYVEFRLLFPKPRVSFFLGTPLGVPTWFYVQGEYHVEAYQIDINGPRRTAGGVLVPVGDTRVQLQDWRVVGGLYAEGQWFTAFLEMGGVFGREVSYDGPVRGFDVDSGFILRTGFSW